WKSRFGSSLLFRNYMTWSIFVAENGTRTFIWFLVIQFSRFRCLATASVVYIIFSMMSTTFFRFLSKKEARPFW
ncbi:MAG: hypothetical protein SPL32_03755, partial [Succiniclasticum sp.]|nr:hypothetical protein [Succiniclasticum sp.]